MATPDVPRPSEATHPRIDIHADGDWHVAEGHGGWYRVVGPSRGTPEEASKDRPCPTEAPTKGNGEPDGWPDGVLAAASVLEAEIVQPNPKTLRQIVDTLVGLAKYYPGPLRTTAGGYYTTVPCPVRCPTHCPEHRPCGSRQATESKGDDADGTCADPKVHGMHASAVLGYYTCGCYGRRRGDARPSGENKCGPK